MSTARICLLLIVSCLPLNLAVGADPAADMFFEQKIRPVLVEHCYSCHSTEAAAKKQLKSGLLVDSREGLRRGGDSGPAVVPGDLDASLLIAALKHDSFKMPPSGKLPASVIADFEHWIKLGAHDPRETPAGAKPVHGPSIDIDRARREHWAFQPLSSSPPPEVKNRAWVLNDIDRYILAAMEAQGLTPAASADPFVLTRRAHFDLIGLPPSLAEIERVGQTSALDDAAYAALLDRLLASPHYGERWGRHWLDLARYADSSGFHSDLDRPNAWRYRDYVIESFNQDKPYPQFIAEQLAGDELDKVNDQTRIATGFGCNGPSNDDNAGTGKAKLKYRLDLLDDVVSTTSTVFLGLTIGCARCHDHKIDPLTSVDYYSLLAIFDNTERVGVSLTKAVKKSTEPPAAIQQLIEKSSQVRPTRVLRRGNIDFPGDEVGPAVPTVLVSRPVTFPTPSADASTTGRRRQFAEWLGSPDNALVYRVLANRVWQHHFGRGLVATPSNFGLGGAKPTHPELLDYLAGQIIAHGGRIKPLHKLIMTSSTYRQKAESRKLKAETDTQLSAFSSQHSTDPDNLLLTRFTPRRLEAEVLRDAVLSASGNLNLRSGGPGIKPRIRNDLITTSQRNKWPELKQEGPNEWRRSVYIYVKRQLLMPLMELFDAPTTTDSCPERMSSVVPTQALVLMNDEFIDDQARYLARRLLADSRGDVRRAVERALQLTWGKRPSPERIEQAVAFVNERKQAYLVDKISPDDARHRAVTDLAHVLFNSSEFVYVE
ncbi:MAG: PSD1 domain-containing protein [Planctomycetaceae bacterium]|nr:PSD1 domain-containing protein [Planctomycetaceae bacterium]